jgi:hypothetical protein
LLSLRDNQLQKTVLLRHPSFDLLPLLSWHLTV